jgi:coenzyme F420-reducing hydrogenase alpha subunit
VHSAPVADLRRLLYCGEWIESHALHIYLLHAPDFLGYASALDLAREGRGLVERGLALKKAGNSIMELVGGRAIHPVNVRVGGFYRGFEFPDFHHEHEMLALVTPGSTPSTGARSPLPAA